MKVLLAMSGGVDSSVVAHLLCQEGHEVIGVRFTLWTDPLAPAIAQILPSKCCTTQNIARASAVAKALKIPLHIIDLEKEFKEQVVDPYLRDHMKGLTPNPCIGCNRSIKFGKLIEIADELGCEKLATGHYARISSETLDNGRTKSVLLQAKDTRKDQSYYLYGLTQEQLSKTMFPLGEMTKKEIYSLAVHFGVPLPDSYRESQDLCFFPEKTPEAFLARHLKETMKPGSIMRRNGTVLGIHKGLPLYTVGQRRGLGIGGLTIPLEVIEKDPETNTLFVSDKGSTLYNSVTLTDMQFISLMPKEGTHTRFECRTRSLSVKKKGVLFFSKERAEFIFDIPISPLAPGQSLVLYRGDEVVGGGVIQAKI